MSRTGDEMEALQALMRRLRDPQHGCPWDRAQDFVSIAPYAVEEAHEVADAIARNDFARLRDELGDLLFQVVFHARLAEEAGRFDLAAVIGGIRDKLTRRHPHVFGDTRIEDTSQLNAAWEAHKAAERAAAGAVGVLADVPLALPALIRAAKLGRRAAGVGFDWQHAADARAKVSEELAEVDAAITDAAVAVGSVADATVAAANTARIGEELGDLLFAVANWARHLHVDAEDALRGAARKFERRFAAMQRRVEQSGGALEQLSAQAWDTQWNLAKAEENAPSPTAEREG